MWKHVTGHNSIYDINYAEILVFFFSKPEFSSIELKIFLTCSKEVKFLWSDCKENPNRKNNHQFSAEVKMPQRRTTKKCWRVYSKCASRKFPSCCHNLACISSNFRAIEWDCRQLYQMGFLNKIWQFKDYFYEVFLRYCTSLKFLCIFDIQITKIIDSSNERSDWQQLEIEHLILVNRTVCDKE